MAVNIFEPVVYGAPLAGIAIYYFAGKILRKTGWPVVCWIALLLLSIPFAFNLLRTSIWLLEFCDKATICSAEMTIDGHVLFLSFVCIPLYLIAAIFGLRRSDSKEQEKLSNQ